jgi:tryptophanase
VSSLRHALFTVQTQASVGVRAVTLHQDTWEKVTRSREYLANKLDVIRSTLERTSYVATSTSVVGRVVFVNSEITTSKGHPLRIPVSEPDPLTGFANVVSVYYSLRPQEVIIWPTLAKIGAGDDNG